MWLPSYYHWAVVGSTLCLMDLWSQLLMEGKAYLIHFLLSIFSQAALWSQALAGHKSNKASILLHLPLSSCYPAARISCQYKTGFNPFTTHLTTAHTAHRHICELPCANHCEPTVYDWITKPLNIHVVRLHIAGDTGNNYPGPRSAISMNIEQPQRAV